MRGWCSQLSFGEIFSSSWPRSALLDLLILNLTFIVIRALVLTSGTFTLFLANLGLRTINYIFFLFLLLIRSPIIIKWFCLITEGLSSPLLCSPGCIRNAFCGRGCRKGMWVKEVAWNMALGSNGFLDSFQHWGIRFKRKLPVCAKAAPAAQWL